jgi:HEPN domain-containing protein
MSHPEVQYRLKLARGFLEEARHDLQLGRWRFCAGNSQFAAENATKALLALIGPVGRIHNSGGMLFKALEERCFPQEIEEAVRQVAECAERLGPDVHLESDYGDEAHWRTPWELFDRAKAATLFELAEKAVHLTQKIIEQEGEP